ncbi:MAG: threonine/serine exporter family protein [Chloroflexota bacterium]
MTGLDLLSLSLRDVIWSGIAALGFAVLFNVPKRLLLGCFLCGALGHTLRTLLISTGASMEFSSLFGAAAVGFLSVYLSERYEVPASIFAVTGAIPLVPGVFAYQTIVGLLNATAATSDQSVNLLVMAVISGVRTAVILGAIAFGIAAPTLLFRRSNPTV